MLERLFPQQADDKLFVEDCFSCFLYTGNGGTQTITNGIDLAGKGGLVWSKGRSGASGAQRHNLFDTARGKGSFLSSNSTNEQFTFTSDTQDLTSFNSNGFSVGIPYNANVNQSSTDYATWTFRKAPKFFDVVTYTGNGVSGRSVPHNLGVAPGCIMIKNVSSTVSWVVYHRSLTVNSGAPNNLYLDLTNGEAAGGNFTAVPTSTEFFVGPYVTNNASGTQYVAYLFAHDPSADGIIQCGSFNNSGGLATVTLGWEPQWILMKNAAAAGDWFMVDNMRGLVVGGFDPYLYANSAVAEDSGDIVTPTATGFVTAGLPGSTNFIYMAIRRGPMRTPTLGTSVFSPTKQTSTGYTQITGINFAPDFVFQKAPSDGGDGWNAVDKLRGPSASLAFNTTGAEVVDTQFFLGGFLNSGVKMGTASNGQFNGYNPNSLLFFQRAPGFFDEVCYTGTGAVLTQSHNLGVVPELMIVKRRTGGTGVWPVYYGDATRALFLEDTVARGFSGAWNDTAPTATQFTVNGASTAVGAAGSTYVAYLFASVPGVSKVGSYTGNGSSQTINCAFTTGARFVLIKRTDSTGDWYVWDSARGIVAGNDPYLALNTTAAEVSNDSVDPDSTGFVVNQVAASNINVNAATYVFLAIA